MNRVHANLEKNLNIAMVQFKLKKLVEQKI